MIDETEIDYVALLGRAHTVLAPVLASGHALCREIAVTAPRLELIKFQAPPTQGGNPDGPANAPGIRHVAFVVEDIDAVVAGLRARGSELVGELVRYEDSFRLCYVRGPEGIIVELAEKIG